MSAIRLGEQRTLNGAFHSACVSLLLVWVRHRYGDEEAVTQTLAELRGCAEAVADHRAWFSPFGQRALDAVLEFALNPEPETLGAMLRARVELRAAAA